MLSSILEVEKSAASVEMAVDSALAELGCSRAEVEITIVQAPSRGVLGLFGKKPGRVRVKLTDRAFAARRLAAELLRKAGISATVSVLPARDRVELDIDSPDSSLVIGRHGQTLNALQALVNALVDRWQFAPHPVIVDVDGYRARRTASVQRLTRRLATRARLSGEPAPLPSLSPDEQRIVQQVVRHERGVAASTIGRGPQRRLVLLPKG